MQSSNSGNLLSKNIVVVVVIVVLCTQEASDQA